MQLEMNLSSKSRKRTKFEEEYSVENARGTKKKTVMNGKKLKMRKFRFSRENAAESPSRRIPNLL